MMRLAAAIMSSWVNLGRGLLVGPELVELNVHAEHVAALARQDQHVAFAGRGDQALLPHVREIGVGQDVHHAPGLVAASPCSSPPIALRTAECAPSHRRRSSRAPCVRGPPVHAAGVLERDGHRVVVGRRSIVRPTTSQP